MRDHRLTYRRGSCQVNLGQLSGTAVGRAEKRTLAVLSDAGGGDVFLQVTIKIVVCWHFVLFAAFLVKPAPSALALHKIVFDLHGNHRPHAGEGVDHQTDHGKVAEDVSSATLRNSVSGLRASSITRSFTIPGKKSSRCFCAAERYYKFVLIPLPILDITGCGSCAFDSIFA